MAKLFTDDQLRRRDLTTLKHWLRSRLGGYVVAIKWIRTDNLLYRGVKCSARPTEVGRISYPPADKVSKYGRVNRVGEAVFYASRGAPAVVYELRAKQGDLIALSEWEVGEPLWMHNLGYHQDALASIGATDMSMRLPLVHSIPNESAENARLRRQLSLAFIEDVTEGYQYRYKQSITIKEVLLDKAEPFEPQPNGPKHVRAAGIVYPALQMRGAADNVAIWPEFVDSCLRLKSLRYVLIEAADAATSSYSFLTLGFATDFPGNKILWRDLNLPESRRRSHITFDGSEWVLRDGFNRIYDRH
jgi:hypothetical protein